MMLIDTFIYLKEQDESETNMLSEYHWFVSVMKDFFTDLDNSLDMKQQTGSK